MIASTILLTSYGPGGTYQMERRAEEDGFQKKACTRHTGARTLSARLTSSYLPTTREQRRKCVGNMAFSPSIYM